MKKTLDILTRTSDNEKRNEKELKMLLPLISELKFFKSTTRMKHDDMIDICRSVQYEFKEPGATIFRQGDPGEKLYIILKGECQISVMDPLESATDPPKKK